MANKRKVLKQLSRDLRRNATPQENHLWYDFLRDYPFQFRRQVPIERAIVDFYCAAAKLAVEIDGEQHYTEQGIAYDTERSTILNGKGVLVLRFTNKSIERNFDAVCKRIDSVVHSRIEQ